MSVIHTLPTESMQRLFGILMGSSLSVKAEIQYVEPPKHYKLLKTGNRSTP